MHVGFVTAGDIDTGSGGFYYDRRLRDRLRERGHEVTVVSLPWGRYGDQLLGTLRGRGWGIRNRGFDIVLEDGLAHPSLLWANRRIDAPTVALLHMLRTAASGRRSRPLVRAVERRFLRGVDTAIYNSAATRRRAESLSGPAGTVVPPGGDRFGATSSPEEIRERARSGPLEVGFLGNVIERKGLDVVVEALSTLSTDWRLTVVGAADGDRRYVESVRRSAERAEVAGRIRFRGRLPDAAVESQLRETHVLAVPSRYEPFGMAHLEAMGFGCVPIATTNGGPSEFIEDGECGFLVPPDDPGAVAERLAALSDRDRLATLGVAAREAFDRQPGWDDRLDRAAGFLEERCPGT